MNKKTAGKRKGAKPGNIHKAARKDIREEFATAESCLKDGFATVESYLKEGYAAVESHLPTGSQQRTVGGIAAAAGGALLASAAFGVGPAALAGACRPVGRRPQGFGIRSKANRRNRQKLPFGGFGGGPAGGDTGEERHSPVPFSLGLRRMTVRSRPPVSSASTLVQPNRSRTSSAS